MLAFPGVYGQMATGAAPNDPIFWPIHPLFEKAWQVLRLAPAFEGFNTTWVNKLASGSTCHGTGWREDPSTLDRWRQVTAAFPATPRRRPLVRRPARRLVGRLDRCRSPARLQ